MFSIGIEEVKDSKKVSLGYPGSLESVSNEYLNKIKTPADFEVIYVDIDIDVIRSFVFVIDLH